MIFLQRGGGGKDRSGQVIIMRTKCTNRLLPIAVLLLLLLPFPPTAYCQQALQLTDNHYSDASPQINCSGDIVWIGQDGYAYEVCLYERSSDTITRLSENDYGDWYARINAGGDVAWVGYTGMVYTAHLYDRSAGTVTRLADNTVA